MYTKTFISNAINRLTALIFFKYGCYDIYILETSETSLFSTPQQSTRVINIRIKQTKSSKLLRIIKLSVIKEAKDEYNRIKTFFF